MLAHHEPHGHVRQESPKPQTKHAAQFMFIDSSNGGVNAKPDKVVRSFVMKSARNKKSWSTRPKSPRRNPSSDVKTKRRSSSRKHSMTAHGPIDGSLSRLDCNRSWESGYSSSITSPNSFKSESIFSCSGSNCACDSVASCSTSPRVEYAHDEDDFTCLPYHSRPLMYRKSPRITSMRSFDCLVVNLDIQAETLLHRFIENAAPRLLPIDPFRSSEKASMRWMANCIQSDIGAPFIYAVLTSSARAAQIDPELYKWRAMSEVNGLLSHPRTSTNDTTIAAVLILLANEEADLADPRRQGDRRECSLMVNEAHHNGLRTMIQQRGGLAALSGNRVLQVCLLMHSIAQAITTFNPPYAVILDTNGQIEDYVTSTSRPPSTSAQTLRQFRDMNIDRALFKIVVATNLFVADLKIWYEEGSCPVDSLDLQKHASLLMYRLFHWYQHNGNDSHSTRSSANPVDQSICLALLIFMVNATDQTASSSGSRLSKTVTKLRQALCAMQFFQWGKAPNLLFWVLTMGALGAKGLPKSHLAPNGEPESVFFQEHIRFALAGEAFTQDTSTDRLLDKVRTCLWIPSVFDARAEALWVSMGLCGACIIDIEDVSSSDGEQVEDEYALGQSTTLRFFTAD